MFLQDSFSPYAYTLLSSSPWSSSLFPVSIVLELSKSPALQGLSLLEYFGWTESRYDQLRGEVDQPFFAGSFSGLLWWTLTSLYAFIRILYYALCLLQLIGL